MHKGFDFYKYKVVGSTNDVCFEKIKNKESKVVIFAEEQTAGRGRNNKKWQSPKGNISYSFGFKNKQTLKALSLQAGLCVRDCLKEIYSVDVKLKWPNDLIFKSKKIGGILIESKTFGMQKHTVIGVGINLKIKSEESHWGDINKKQEYKKIENFIMLLTNRLINIADGKFNVGWTNDWLNNCVHMNKDIQIENTKEKLKFIGLGENGELIGLKNGVQHKIVESSIKVEGLY